MNAGRIAPTIMEHPTPWPWSIPTVTPAMVACPCLVTGGLAALAVAQELYRIAYERAVAEARPSRYELAVAVSLN